MQIKAPVYYEKFKCIADRCTHSCCIGWEIDIDSDAVARYALLPSGAREQILESIEYDGDVPHFRLLENDRCPHLTENNLCNIITDHGENYLCNICREHPRFYHDTADGKEVGLGASCEEAARLILSCDDYRSMIAVGETDGVPSAREFDSKREREIIYATLSDTSRPYEERLEDLKNSYGISPEILTDEEWRGVISSLEYLEEEHLELFLNYTSTPKIKEEDTPMLERFLAYLIYRHGTESETKAEFCTSLGFSFFAERLLASLLCKNKNSNPAALVRIISEELEYSEDNTAAIKFEFI